MFKNKNENSQGLNTKIDYERVDQFEKTKANIECARKSSLAEAER